MDRNPISFSGIGVKLTILSVAVFLGIGATIFIGWQALSRLSFTIGSQSSSATVSFASYDIQQRCFVTWLSLFRLHEDSLNARRKAPLSGEDYKSSLADAEQVLKNLLALRVGKETAAVFGDLDSAFKGFQDDADKAAAALVAGDKQAPNLFQFAGYSFSSLEAQLTRLDNAMRQNSAGLAADGAKRAASASRALALVSVFVVLLVLFLSIVIVRSITRPLGRLVGAFESTGEGDLRASCVDAGGGELGLISCRFEGLVGELRVLATTVKEKLGQLEDEARALESSMAESGESAQLIKARVDDSKTKLEEQSEAVQRVSSSIDSLIGSIGELNAKIESQSDLIGESSASVEQMIANIESVAANAQS